MRAVHAVPRRLALVLLAAALLLAGGCGLFLSSPPPGFRQYPLAGVGLVEAEEIVREVTARVYGERFGGGFTIDWDPGRANLDVSPVHEGQRRMRLFVKLVPEADGTLVEMLALVEHLDASGGGRLWTRPMQDVPFEELLYEEFILEVLARRGT